MLRTHTCGELRKEDVESTTTLCGWVQNYRDFGGLVFIDLRDRYGITQVVFNPDYDPQMHAVARDLRAEDVIQVTGQVLARGVDDKGRSLENPKLSTGAVEVRARSLSVLNKSNTPPFEPNQQTPPNEEFRLQHRYVDLRRRRLQDAMALKHRLMQVTRSYLDGLEFLEIETPILGKSTPEGARDYLVPSRIHEGRFYALPQSPQIYKQILMVAGYDRYYQIARCFRDEDLRADRQPEFTQIDLEMSFVEREDVLRTTDGLIAAMHEAIKGKPLSLPLPRYTYHDVMERFGTDKPDMRFGMELVGVDEVASSCGFGVFNKAIESGGRVRGLNAKGAAESYSRKDIDGLTEFVKGYGAKGLAFFRVKENAGNLQLDSPIAKFFDDAHQQTLISKLGGEAGDLLFFVADAAGVTSAALSALRNRLGRELKLYGPDDFDCHWVLDFPLLAWNDEEQRFEAEHHPFCMLHPEDVDLLESDPGRVRAASYDLVCNGYEAASGSVRIHSPKIQQQVFDAIGISAAEAEERFSFLLEALRYGAPPHAGIALGLDRWVMLFGGYDNIRDVIAFPKTQKASDLMTGAPGEVEPKQLKELHIRLDTTE